jgi:hypothetical protein
MPDPSEKGKVIPVGSKMIESILVLLLIAGLVGCATVTSSERTSSEDSEIAEEDLKDHGSNPRESDSQHPARQSDVFDSEVPSYDRSKLYEPPVDAGAQTTQHPQPPSNETESPPPRKFKWRDRKGTKRSWELSTEREEAGD